MKESIIPQRKELIGALCGVSDISLEGAKKNAYACSRVVVITSYGTMYGSDIGHFSYAYPVPYEKLEELINIIKC